MVVDILVLVVLLISALIAFLRGFIREVLTITGVVGGLAAAYFGGPLLKPTMRGWFGVEEGIEPERLFGVIPYDVLADALSYASIFIIVVILLSIFSHFLAEAARKIGLGAVDRTLGFVFGLFRGVLILGILYLLPHIYFDQETKDEWFDGSRTHIYLEKTAEILHGFFPEEALDQAKEDMGRIEENANQASKARETLQKIELLRDENEAPQTTPSNSDPAPSEGYSDEFRDQMDQLFDDETMQNSNESLNR